MEKRKIIKGEDFKDLALLLLVFFPLWLIEIFIIFYVSSWMLLLNDVFVFDDAQYISYGQDIILGKDYWFKSAITNTIYTISISVVLALILFTLNYFIFKSISIKKHRRYAVIVSLISMVSVNLTGMYATILMLISSHHIWRF